MSHGHHASSPARDPDIDDSFSQGLDPDRWIPHYLPHWTTPERSAARFMTGANGLTLRIDEDQPDWRPEDAPLRVSNLQTGVHGGEVGSTVGTHRHRTDGLTVRTPVGTSLLWTRGAVAWTSPSAPAGIPTACSRPGSSAPSTRPLDCGEVCIVEIDAPADGQGWTARTGVKAHSDPRLRTDMAELPLALDAGRPHTSSVVWGGGRTTIGCDGSVLREIEQSPEYPVALMVDLFEIGAPRGRYPKTAGIHRVVGWGV